MSAQFQLPGYCWRCQNRRVLTVAAAAITPDGDRYCVEEVVPCSVRRTASLAVSDLGQRVSNSLRRVANTSPKVSLILPFE